MQWTIPGTVLTGPRDDPDGVEQQLRSMFLAGGMVRSQVAALTGLEAHAIQNWVKRGFLSPPVAKRYTLRQLCRIVLINMMKSAMSMDSICALLGYINGQLDDESDDLIGDEELYFAFVRVASRCSGLLEDQTALHQCIRENLRTSQTDPQSIGRIEQVLEIMLMAWGSSLLQQQAHNRLCAIIPTTKGE